MGQSIPVSFDRYSRLISCQVIAQYVLHCLLDFFMQYINAFTFPISGKENLICDAEVVKALWVSLDIRSALINYFITYRNPLRMKSMNI